MLIVTNVFFKSLRVLDYYQANIWVDKPYTGRAEPAASTVMSNTILYQLWSAGNLFLIILDECLVGV